MLSIVYSRTPNAFVDVKVGAKNPTISILFVMQKLKFMQEFTCAIDVGCLQSSLQAKLQMHNCASAKHAKTGFVKVRSSGK